MAAHYDTKSPRFVDSFVQTACAHCSQEEQPYIEQAGTLLRTLYNYYEDQTKEAYNVIAFFAGHGPEHAQHLADNMRLFLGSNLEEPGIDSVNLTTLTLLFSSFLFHDIGMSFKPDGGDRDNTYYNDEGFSQLTLDKQNQVVRPDHDRRSVRVVEQMFLDAPCRAAEKARYEPLAIAWRAFWSVRRPHWPTEDANLAAVMLARVCQAHSDGEDWLKVESLEKYKPYYAENQALAAVMLDGVIHLQPWAGHNNWYVMRRSFFAACTLLCLIDLTDIGPHRFTMAPNRFYESGQMPIDANARAYSLCHYLVHKATSVSFDTKNEVQLRVVSGGMNCECASSLARLVGPVRDAAKWGCSPRLKLAMAEIGLPNFNGFKVVGDGHQPQLWQEARSLALTPCFAECWSPLQSPLPTDEIVLGDEGCAHSEFDATVVRHGWWLDQRSSWLGWKEKDNAALEDLFYIIALREELRFPLEGLYKLDGDLQTGSANYIVMHPAEPHMRTSSHLGDCFGALLAAIKLHIIKHPHAKVIPVYDNNVLFNMKEDPGTGDYSRAVSEIGFDDLIVCPVPASPLGLTGPSDYYRFWQYLKKGSPHSTVVFFGAENTTLRRHLGSDCNIVAASVLGNLSKLAESVIPTIGEVLISGGLVKDAAFASPAAILAEFYRHHKWGDNATVIQLCQELGHAEDNQNLIDEQSTRVRGIIAGLIVMQGLQPPEEGAAWTLVRQVYDYLQQEMVRSDGQSLLASFANVRSYIQNSKLLEVGAAVSPAATRAERLSPELFFALEKGIGEQAAAFNFYRTASSIARLCACGQGLLVRRASGSLGKNFDEVHVRSMAQLLATKAAANLRLCTGFGVDWAVTDIGPIVCASNTALRIVFGELNRVSLDLMDAHEVLVWQLCYRIAGQLISAERIDSENRKYWEDLPWGLPTRLGAIEALASIGDDDRAEHGEWLLTFLLDGSAAERRNNRTVWEMMLIDIIAKYSPKNAVLAKVRKAHPFVRILCEDENSGAKERYWWEAANAVHKGAREKSDADNLSDLAFDPTIKEPWLKAREFLRLISLEYTPAHHQRKQ